MTKTDAQDYIQLCCNGIGWKQKFKSWDIKPQQARGCWFQLGVSEKMDVPWSSMFQKTSKNSPAILGLLRLPWQKGPPNPQRIPWPCQVNLGFVVLATQLRLGGSSSVRRFPVAKAALQLGQTWGPVLRRVLLSHGFAIRANHKRTASVFKCFSIYGLTRYRYQNQHADLTDWHPFCIYAWCRSILLKAN
jgi:hypothetical protein